MPGSGGDYFFLHKKSSNCGKALKLFQPSKSGNISYGSINDLRDGNIETNARKEIGNPQPITFVLYVGQVSARLGRQSFNTLN